MKIFSRSIGVLVVLGLILFFWYRHALGAVDGSSDVRVPFIVPAGASLATIAAGLDDAELIRSSFAFKTHVRRTDRDHLLRAGSYVLSRSMTAEEIVLVLTGDGEGEVSITIPEGFTVADIDRMMAAKGFTETGAIIACAKTCDFSLFSFLPKNNDGPGGRIEGYLYPDTYFVGGEGSDPQAFLSRLLSTFEAKVPDGVTEDIVIMASLIEKEAAGDDERAVISGILWKRLDEGIILGVDASVRYAVNKPSREPLTQADLDSPSPYNIRAKRGLPPGPIANPGLASIEAALHPETTKYYYYLHGNDGEIRYAVTNDEHNANRARYLR